MDSMAKEVFDAAALVADDGRPDDPGDDEDRDTAFRGPFPVRVVQEQPAVRLASLALQQALALGNAAVEIEGQTESMRLTFNGTAVPPFDALPPHVLPKMMARYKRMARLNSAEHRKAQEGEFTILWYGEK